MIIRFYTNKFFHLCLTFALIALTWANAPTIGHAGSEDASPKRAASSGIRKIKSDFKGSTSASVGTLSGRITCNKTNEPIAGVGIVVEEAQVDTVSDSDGRFELTLPVGVYKLSFSHMDFLPKKIRDVAVVEDRPTVRNVQLTDMYKMSVMVVSGSQIAGSIPSLLEEKRAAPSVVDVLSAEEMSRAGDSDIAQALRRVTGLNLAEGKYVYVRGMGERYSSVLLNGANLAGTDPNRRVIELDLIPTGVLEAAVIQKSYSPDLPGAFGGGNILLRTKTYPDRFFATLSASTAYQTNTTFKDGYRYEGGGLDFLGADDGTRSLPEIIPDEKIQTVKYTADELKEFGKSFSDIYDVEKKTIPPDLDLGFNIGDRFDAADGDVVLGYTMGLKYKQSWMTQTDEIFKKLNLGHSGVEVGDDWDYNWTERKIVTSGLLNLGTELFRDHKLSTTTLYLRNTSDTARDDVGFVDDEDAYIRQTSLSWVERSLLVQQISGTHLFPEASDLGIDWSYTYAHGRYFVPDERITHYFLEDDRQEWALFGGYGQDERNYKNMDDDSHDFSADASLPLEPGFVKELTLKTGYRHTFRKRDSTIRRFRFTHKDLQKAYEIIRSEESLEDILTDENFDAGIFELRETTQPSDKYSALERINAVYGMADVRINDAFGITGGIRFEDSHLNIDTFELAGTEIDQDLDNRDYLPAVSGTWFIDDETKLRAAYGETLCRPDFKELSRAPFFDPVTKRIVRGNPDLQEAHIKNYDLRLEHFFSPDEIASISVFYKTFTNPIERVQVESVQEERTYINADSAYLYGFELELNKNLSFIHDALFNFFVGANFTYIKSEAEVGEGRSDLEVDVTNNKHPLQGQPEYLMNFMIGYDDQGLGLLSLLLLNVQGKTIDAVGTDDLPDQFREPFYQLDYVLSYKLAEDLTIRFEAENLLDPRDEYTQGGVTTRSFRKGRKFTVGLEYALF